MKIFRMTALALLLTCSGAAAQEQQQEFSAERGHDYASLFQIDMQVDDFTFPLLEGGEIRLRDAVRGRKLILIHYFASWCHNSNYDVVTINELYRKYRDAGLEVIAVCEYSNRDSIRKFVGKHKPEYRIAVEGNGKRNERATSTHYKYRMKAADTRLWGTPLNILIDARDITPDGDIVASKARIANGELIKSEVEELIQELLK